MFDAGSNEGVLRSNRGRKEAVVEVKTTYDGGKGGVEAGKGGESEEDVVEMFVCGWQMSRGGVCEVVEAAMNDVAVL